MEYALGDAKARLSELVAAAESGERVVITRHGKPAVELVRCRMRGGIDFAKLEAARRKLGIADAAPAEAAAWKADFENPAFSRQVMGFAEEPRAEYKAPSDDDDK